MRYFNSKGNRSTLDTHFHSRGSKSVSMCVIIALSLNGILGSGAVFYTCLWQLSYNYNQIMVVWYSSYSLESNKTNVW